MVEVGFVKFILRIEHGTYHVRSSVWQLAAFKIHTFLEIPGTFHREMQSLS